MTKVEEQAGVPGICQIIAFFKKKIKYDLTGTRGV